MLIRVRDNRDIPPSEITGETAFINRRRFLAAMGVGVAAISAGTIAEPRVAYRASVSHRGPDWLEEKLSDLDLGPFSTNENATPWDYVTGYNNFYEFGTDKTDPAENARDFVTDPWSVEVSGHAENPGRFHMEDLVQPHRLEERVYRLRCVEAWSMVVPWVGIPLKSVLARFKPTSDAKYVRFKTLYDPEQMPEQRSRFSSIDYPYVEGLRIDEAMNDLAFLAVGVYGRALPNQNGAPLRLVVPWKYGFKSIKSIVSIEFMSSQPKTTWELANAREYGFFANVNPDVDHPRWSQAQERRLPSSLFSRNTVETLMFNGYAPQVAHLYSGMNLVKHF